MTDQPPPAPARPALTAKQQAVRDFVDSYRQEHGFPPALRDIMLHFSFGSTNAVNCHLRALIRKGYLKPRDPKKSRALVIIDAP